jgi:hypothetical protein
MRHSSGSPIATTAPVLLFRPMANELHSESEPKKNEAPSDPKLRERAERLTEKVSELSDTLREIEQTIEKKS